MIRVLSCFTLLVSTVALPAGWSPSAAGAQPSWSYADLVGRMLDLTHPATLPLAGEKCAQWASWDRASRYDAELGTHELAAGQHKLTVQIVGANPNAIPSYMFGLDRVILEP